MFVFGKNRKQLKIITNNNNSKKIIIKDQDSCLRIRCLPAIKALYHRFYFHSNTVSVWAKKKTDFTE